MAGDNLKVFNCPNCGGEVTVRAVGQTVSVVCRSCGSIIDTTNEHHKILSKVAAKDKVLPLIPIGQRGKLHGVVWENIGFMQRADGSGMYRWREYLLHNPLRGFRWLTEFDGHWNYVVTIKEKPRTTEKEAILRGETYALFHKGIAKVTYVLGEFYWRVKVGEKVSVKDYIAPPEMLSCESSDGEIVWSLGEYINADVIRSAFDIKTPMPFQTGVAPNQQSTLSSAAPTITKYWMVFLALIFAMQIFSVAISSNEQVYKGNFDFVAEENLKVSPPFELKGHLSNLEFHLETIAENEWFEVEVNLINDENGETYTFEQGVEYYSGFDSDGHWREGSQSSYKRLNAIPAGIYHLNLETSNISKPWTITVRRNVPTWFNFFLCLVLLSLFPTFAWVRRKSFEMARWSNSDFSPYWWHQESDDFWNSN